MTTGNYITREELREELALALRPIVERLDRLEAAVNDNRARTNQMYDALAQHGLPLPARS